MKKNIFYILSFVGTILVLLIMLWLGVWYFFGGIITPQIPHFALNGGEEVFIKTDNEKKLLKHTKRGEIIYKALDLDDNLLLINIHGFIKKDRMIISIDEGDQL